MTPQDWNAALAPDVPWQKAYATVEQHARAHLTANPVFAGGEYSTTELVEALYPEKLAIGDGILARRRIFKALAALATRGLADCASRGATRKLGGKGVKIKPWVWHEPREKNPEAMAKNVCPHCGGEL